MQLYDAFMRPLEILWFRDYRRILLREVKGDVLEVGIGTGANLSFYNYNIIKTVKGIDIDVKLPLLKKMNEKVFVYKSTSNKIPFDDNSFDSIVLTLVLCSVENQEEYLNEIKRVLKPDGRIYFLEHIKPAGISEKMLEKINVPWNKMSKCNLNRDTDKLLLNNFKEIRVVKTLKNIVCMGILENNK